MTRLLVFVLALFGAVYTLTLSTPGAMPAPVPCKTPHQVF